MYTYRYRMPYVVVPDDHVPLQMTHHQETLGGIRRGDGNRSIYHKTSDSTPVGDNTWVHAFRFEHSSFHFSSLKWMVLQLADYPSLFTNKSTVADLGVTSFLQASMALRMICNSQRWCCNHKSRGSYLGSVTGGLGLWHLPLGCFCLGHMS